ncbi:hydantoinase/oxoprolinase family protein [Desulfotalea psychrophila]|uniref:Related to hydantoin utilization protein A n=1 Tax=Desulfotalea psychrophila (strain LSv54 / DSM 12343) TaxID=177439 RepID=Q6APS4_DESPS|nr:hydantoinase/oxoprolinase family protein [Desulfotalea psychrophila]CAG35650.1 related to hydantoin utilization protein A [Desulfotalea psychrophila LSv54]
MNYVIGIDTGGTCTDAVLMEQDTGKIIATAKRPTTHHNLALGTRDALSALLDASAIEPHQVKKIAVSSTLATNSVVENKGAEVALLVIGYVKHFKLPVKAVVFIKGGHNIQGKEEVPLDLEYLVSIIEGLREEVDAYGICSAMSIKNPAHELVAQEAIKMLDGDKPVFCSHQASNIAGMEQRAATAGLHAKLMPVMQNYVDAVLTAMEEKNLSCPMTLVAGNGQLVDASHIIRHAALTVASGPACTAHFGSMQTDLAGLVIDIGGTTTDITMLDNNGQPVLREDGCQIGSWRTHIEAVDMHTGAIGGDSHVQVERGDFSIGPVRVTPISLCPIGPSLEEWLTEKDSSKLIIPVLGQREEAPTDIFTFLQGAGAATVKEICKATGHSGIILEKQLEKLAKNQLIIECGFTPTDALHVLGKINLGDGSRARRAADILGKKCEMTAEEFSQQVVNRSQNLIENLILDYVIQHYWGNSLTNFIENRKKHPMLGVDFTIKAPLIGIGAVARHLLPEVAKKLGTMVSFPLHCEVGNAVGAAHIACIKE